MRLRFFQRLPVLAFLAGTTLLVSLALLISLFREGEMGFRARWINKARDDAIALRHGVNQFVDDFETLCGEGVLMRVARQPPPYSTRDMLALKRFRARNQDLIEQVVVEGPQGARAIRWDIYNYVRFEPVSRTGFGLNTNHWDGPRIQIARPVRYGDGRTSPPWPRSIFASMSASTCCPRNSRSPDGPRCWTRTAVRYSPPSG